MSTQSAPPCLFFAKGACRNGSSCRFSHGGASQVAQPPSFGAVGGGGQGRGHGGVRECTFYKKGACRNGSSCQFAHVDGPAAATSTATAMPPPPPAAMQAVIPATTTVAPPAPAPAPKSSAEFTSADLRDLEEFGMSPINPNAHAFLLAVRAGQAQAQAAESSNPTPSSHSHLHSAYTPVQEFNEPDFDFDEAAYEAYGSHSQGANGFSAVEVGMLAEYGIQPTDPDAAEFLDALKAGMGANDLEDELSVGLGGCRWVAVVEVRLVQEEEEEREEEG